MYQNLSQKLEEKKNTFPFSKRRNQIATVLQVDNDDVPSNLDSPPSSLSYALRLFKSLKPTISGVVSRETASALCADGEPGQRKPSLVLFHGRYSKYNICLASWPSKEKLMRGIVGKTSVSGANWWVVTVGKIKKRSKVRRHLKSREHSNYNSLTWQHTSGNWDF